jgi:hypothetical protein
MSSRGTGDLSSREYGGVRILRDPGGGQGLDHRIQRRGDLVARDQVRHRGNRPRESHARLLPARHVTGQPVSQGRRQAHHGRKRGHPRLARGAFPPVMELHRIAKEFLYGMRGARRGVTDWHPICTRRNWSSLRSAGPGAGI